MNRPQSDITGNYLAQEATGGVLQGVTPVALTLPGYSRSITVSQELVTRQRPFRPVLLYITAWSLIPVAALWFGLLALLIYLHRDDLAALRARLRARLERPDPVVPPTTPAA